MRSSVLACICAYCTAGSSRASMIYIRELSRSHGLRGHCPFGLQLFLHPNQHTPAITRTKSSIAHPGIVAHPLRCLNVSLEWEWIDCYDLCHRDNGGRDTPRTWEQTRLR